MDETKTRALLWEAVQSDNCNELVEVFLIFRGGDVKIIKLPYRSLRNFCKSAGVRLQLVIMV